MGVPKSVTKINKDGVQFIDSVDRVQYTIQELTRAALRDVGKFAVRKTKDNIANAGIQRRTGRMSKGIQYWVRKKDCDLQVGIKPEAFYGGFQELGTEKQPKVAALTHAVEDNIATIREIEGKYLSAIEDEQKALSLIDEDEVISDED